MKKLLLCTLIFACAATARGQQKQQSRGNGWWNDNPSFVVPIGEVGITARRPMKEIGMQQTRLDTVSLHENIALSMADVLTFNTSIFVKQYGRATLSTVAFRGTSPSHTQVTWNGMRINSPMLGMTDFSMIPAYFIDDAALLHGTSSVNVTGGGLGGAVTLATRPADARGFGLQYVQGIGSFSTFDEFLRLTWGNDRWQLSTRVVCSSSPNDFKYRNHNKKLNILDENYHIIASYYPLDRNKSGAYHDLHVLQEAYYNTGRGDRLALQAWYIHSKRGLPMLDVNYRDENVYSNQQCEETFRGVVSWERLRKHFKVGAHAGYIHTWQAYDFEQDLGNGRMEQMIRSRSTINTLYGSAEGEYYIGRKWLFTANVSLHQHFVRSQDKNVIPRKDPNAQGQDNNKQVVVGYDQGRVELTGYVSAKWMPTERLGLSFALREEMYGDDWTPIVPAFFADFVCSKKGNVVAKASISRNYRFPTLNDLYFQPGGNDSLRREHGFTYDAGLSFSVGREGKYTLRGEATWFDSRIEDWILWLPTMKGFWTPVNIKEVHSYGVELKAGLEAMLSPNWQIGADGSFSWTPAINRGEPLSENDRSVGKQLVYIPEYSASLTGRLAYKSWRLVYKWCYYSERFTTSDNDKFSNITRITPYYMSDASLEKLFTFSWAYFSVKLSVKNLFNEEYQSVLSRPMPRMNFEVFLDIKPRWGKRK